MVEREGDLDRWEGSTVNTVRRLIALRCIASPACLVGIEARARCSIVHAYPSSFCEVIPLVGVGRGIVIFAARPAAAIGIRLPHELVPVWLGAPALA